MTKFIKKFNIQFIIQLIFINLILSVIIFSSIALINKKKVNVLSYEIIKNNFFSLQNSYYKMFESFLTTNNFYKLDKKPGPLENKIIQLLYSENNNNKLNKNYQKFIIFFNNKIYELTKDQKIIKKFDYNDENKKIFLAEDDKFLKISLNKIKNLEFELIEFFYDSIFDIVYEDCIDKIDCSVFHEEFKKYKKNKKNKHEKLFIIKIKKINYSSSNLQNYFYLYLILSNIFLILFFLIKSTKKIFKH